MYRFIPYLLEFEFKSRPALILFYKIFKPVTYLNPRIGLVEIFGMQRSLVYISHADGYFLKLVLLRKHIGIALSLRKMNRNRLPQSFKIKIHGLYLIYHYLRTPDVFICLRMNGTVDYPVGPSVDKDIIIIQTDKLLKIYLGVIIAAHLLLDHTVYPRALQHKLHILAALLTVVYIPTAQDELNQRPYRDRYCVFIFKIISGHKIYPRLFLPYTAPAGAV